MGSTTFKDGHDHSYRINTETKNGSTSKDDGHLHKISNGQVLTASKHVHRLLG